MKYTLPAVTMILALTLSACSAAPSPSSAANPAQEPVAGSAFEYQKGNTNLKTPLSAKLSFHLAPDTRLGHGLYSSNIFNDMPNLGDIIHDYTYLGI